MEARCISWGVGVLTAPHRPGPPTLVPCLSALSRAGWPSAITIDDTNRSGCYRGWRAMAGAVLSATPQADLLLLLEDDCILPAGLRGFLDCHLPYSHPHINQCWNSLYCAGGLHSETDIGWRQVQAPRQCWGSVAYVVAPAILRRFLADPPYPSWRDGTDRAVGQFCRVNQIPYLVHSPSLANHVGECSSLDQPGGVDENRRCKWHVTKIGRDEHGAWCWTVAGGEGSGVAAKDFVVP